MNRVHLSADKGREPVLHHVGAEKSYSYDWEGLYKNWNCLFVNLKWLCENWDSQYKERVVEKEDAYIKASKEET